MSWKIVHNILIFVGSAAYLFNTPTILAYDFYSYFAPLHLCLLMYYFNSFLFYIHWEKYPIFSKYLNIFLYFIILCSVVSGDINSYLYCSSKNCSKKTYYLIHITVDSSYLFILMILRFFNRKSIFCKDENDYTVLLTLQYMYILTLISQVVPIYAEKNIEITNDFTFIFWVGFIIEETWRKNINNKQNEETLPLIINEVKTVNIKTIFTKIILFLFILCSTISLYFFVIIYMTTTAGENMKNIWIIILTATNILFYIWTLTTFEKIRY